MKLREKFNTIEYSEYGIDTDKCEEIADDFAVDFAEWIAKNMDVEFDYDETNPESAFIRLLQIYKKEKGL